MREIIDRLKTLLSPTRIGDYLANDLIPDIVVAGLILGLAYLMWRLLARALRVVLGRSQLDATAVNFMQTMVKYLVFTIAGMTALSQLGVDTASLLTSLGVVGLTIGFAARDTLSNVISGLFIFWDRPFVIGDLVDIGGHYGRVDDITMRSTRVVTVDGRMLAFPNSQVINSVVASYTNFPHLRIDIEFTVGLNEDLGRVRELALGVIAEDGRFMDEPAPTVVVMVLGDYNVTLELRAWLDEERVHIVAKTDIRERLFEALRAAGIDMPYETISLVKPNA